MHLQSTNFDVFSRQYTVLTVLILHPAEMTDQRSEVLWYCY